MLGHAERSRAEDLADTLNIKTWPFFAWSMRKTWPIH